jgi:hypothetical protein
MNVSKEQTSFILPQVANQGENSLHDELWDNNYLQKIEINKNTV